MKLLPLLEGVSAIQRPYLYHLTPVANLSGIVAEGLKPSINKSGFSPMSPEIRSKKTKRIFLLPTLQKSNSFLDEWWHGRTEDLVILRVPFKDVKNVRGSADPYYAKYEVWTYRTIPSTHISACLLKTRPLVWEPIARFNAKQV